MPFGMIDQGAGTEDETAVDIQPMAFNARKATVQHPAEEAADRPAQSNGGTGLAIWPTQGGRNQPDTGEN
jgi:hypothetical protein